MNIRTLSAAAFLAIASFASAQNFNDNFESGNLNQWTGKNNGPTGAQIVVDPLNPSNHVINFTHLVSNGDIFTNAALHLNAGTIYTVSFDYLGLTNRGVTNLGGWAGFSKGFPSDLRWYYGTAGDSGTNPIFQDNGQWHHYEYNFAGPISFETGTPSSEIHLMFEQYEHTNGHAGEAYFDNIRLVPEPSEFIVLFAGLAGVAILKRRS